MPITGCRLRNNKQFKDRVDQLLRSNYTDVVRDVPRGRHNLEFAFSEDFFGYQRRWVVVTASGDKILEYDRAVRLVGAFKDDVEQGEIDGVLVLSDKGASKYAVDFIAEQPGFVYRTLEELERAKPMTDETVEIKKDHPSYQAAIDGLDETKELLRGDNGDEIPPSEKARLIAQLEASLSLLRTTEISTELVAKLLLKTLNFIAKALTSRASGMAAGAAITEIMRLFGLH